MLLIVHQCFLMTLSRKIIVFKQTLQTTNKFFIFFILTYFYYFSPISRLLFLSFKFKQPKYVYFKDETLESLKLLLFFLFFDVLNLIKHQDKYRHSLKSL